MDQNRTLIPTKDEMEILQTIAKAAFDSKYFDKIGGFAGIFAITLYAREIGVAPMQAIMGGFSNVMGKITMAPELMNSLIRQNGHKLRIIASTDVECRIEGTRKDSGESYIASFTIQDAQKAGLIKSGGGYDKYAQDMLFARCISRLRRRLFPDVACRSYVTGELDEEPQQVESKPQEKVEEAVVVTEPVSIIEYITSEQAAEIEANIAPDDVEYRTNLLQYFGNIADFQHLPQKSFTSCMKAVMKRAAKMKPKDVEGLSLSTAGEE